LADAGSEYIEPQTSASKPFKDDRSMREAIERLLNAAGSDAKRIPGPPRCGCEVSIKIPRA
jgi:hypothetical protein